MNLRRRPLEATACRRREEFERNRPALSRELSTRGFVTQPGAAISRTAWAPSFHHPLDIKSGRHAVRKRSIRRAQYSSLDLAGRGWRGILIDAIQPSDGSGIRTPGTFAHTAPGHLPRAPRTGRASKKVAVHEAKINVGLRRGNKRGRA
jgi:hypothetical protein